MTSMEAFLEFSIHSALAILMLALVQTALRVILGPTLGDRVLALDQMVVIAIGFIGVIAIKTGVMLYIDIALALGLVGFLATAALARYQAVIAAARKAQEEAGARAETGEKRP